MYEDIIYNKDTGLFYNKKGKQIGWKNGKGYIYITVKGQKAVRANRLAWAKVYGEFPKNEIDHINGIKTDNRIVNLREVTRCENMRNLECHRKGKFPCIKKRWNKYALYIKGKYKGIFNTEEDAQKAFYKIRE